MKLPVAATGAPRHRRRGFVGSRARPPTRCGRAGRRRTRPARAVRLLRARASVAFVEADLRRSSDGDQAPRGSRRRVDGLPSRGRRVARGPPTSRERRRPDERPRDGRRARARAKRSARLDSFTAARARVRPRLAARARTRLFAGSSVYGASKAAASLLGAGRASRGIPLVVLRPFTVYGPGDSPHAWSVSRSPARRRGEDILRHRRRADARLRLRRRRRRGASPSPRTAEAPPGGIFNVCHGHRDVGARRSLEFDRRGMRQRSTTSSARYRYRSDEVSESSGDPGRAGNVLGWQRAYAPSRRA